jgi:hypothetical protein
LSAERQGVDRAQVSMARTAMSHCFISDTILLTVEGESDERSGQDVGGRTRGMVERLTPNPKTGIPMAELGEQGGLLR